MKTLGNRACAICATLFGSVAFVAPAGALDGDYNADGAVDAADYVVWRKTFGTSATLPNDPTPGTVDQSDYDFWRSHFGSGTPVPPTSPGPGDPHLTVTPLGPTPGGYLGFRVDVNKSAAEEPLAVELAFAGSIVQTQVMGFEVDHIVNAESFDGFAGYEMEDDTWYDIRTWYNSNPGNNTFTNAVTEGYVAVPANGTVFVSLGNDPLASTQIELLHLSLLPLAMHDAVLAADNPPVLAEWTGIIAMDGITYSTSGQILIPEPTTAGTALIPLAMLLVHRRSARQSRR